ncbi:hypothetical protein ACCK10_002115, partial [Edwardsiella ictaluri]
VEQALAVFVSSVDLKNLFCQIDADSLNTHDGRSAQVVTIYRPTVAQDVGGDHSINKAHMDVDDIPHQPVPRLKHTV